MIRVRNIVARKDGMTDCEVEHPVYGWVPFTASPHDVESHGREIFAAIDAAKGADMVEVEAEFAKPVSAQLAELRTELAALKEARK